MADRPIRLSEACRFFPDGAMTPSGLRRERDKGNLRTFLIAGKEFTTYPFLKEMIDRCAAMPRDRVSGSVKSLNPGSGSSATALINTARDAALVSVEKLNSTSNATSPQSAKLQKGRDRQR